MNDVPLSDRNGTYGGNSGDKEGVLIGDQYFLIKYPRSTVDLNNTGSLSYTSAPLSEYIGSHIYEILGFDVHETALGIRNGKIVVACEDICDDTHRLIEFRQLKNTYNNELSKALDMTLHSTSKDHFTNLDEVRLHLQYNPEIRNIDGLQNRFWDCIVVDGLINNNDRNNGNWGILRSKTESLLAPVYDNGSSFSPNIPESRLQNKLNNQKLLEEGALNGVTAFSLDGVHNAQFRKLLLADIPELNEAVKRVVPVIVSKINECQSLIANIPERCGGYEVISPVRKQVYMEELQIRVDKLLEPTLQHILQEEHQMDSSIDEFYDDER